MLHTLWGKAKDCPTYNKQEWMFLQFQFELMQIAIINSLHNLRQRTLCPEDIDSLATALEISNKEKP